MVAQSQRRKDCLLGCMTSPTVRNSCRVAPARLRSLLYEVIESRPEPIRLACYDSLTTHLHTTTTAVRIERLIFINNKFLNPARPGSEYK